MPVLAHEPALFPQDLFCIEQRPADSQRRWYVMYTKPRQEKSLARHLIAAEVPFYIPLVTKRWRLRNRPIESYVPLFPCYAFILADRQERLTVLGTQRIVRPLDVVDQNQLWHDLSQVERLLASGAPILPEEKLQPGTQVVIKAGPLRGLQGTILRTERGRRFSVQVNFIQRGASILLDDYLLEECT
jgi:transcription antitermination factor NusG